MRYVTDAIVELFSYIAALLFLCYFSSINFSHPVSLCSFFPLSLIHTPVFM